MPYFDFAWTDEIAAHLAEHGISPEDYEHVVTNPTRTGKSRSSGHPAAWGYTEDGRYIIAVYEKLDFVTVIPVTAYEVPEPRKRR
jgi:uncharacterized DUF497 family protein